MNNAPSVACPVVRSRFQATALALTWLAGVAAIGGWVLLAPPDGIQPVLAVATPLAAGVVAVADWLKGSRGALRWDGARWHWQAVAEPVLSGTLGVVHDLQRHMLVQFQADESGARHWMWFSRKNVPEGWLALRRAMFSHRSSDLLAVAHKPAGPVSPAS